VSDRAAAAVAGFRAVTVCCAPGATDTVSDADGPVSAFASTFHMSAGSGGTVPSTTSVSVCVCSVTVGVPVGGVIVAGCFGG
jgi:hypothetical protein